MQTARSQCPRTTVLCKKHEANVSKQQPYAKSTKPMSANNSPMQTARSQCSQTTVLCKLHEANVHKQQSYAKPHEANVRNQKPHAKPQEPNVREQISLSNLREARFSVHGLSFLSRGCRDSRFFAYLSRRETKNILRYATYGNL